MEDGIQATLLRHEKEEEGDLKGRIWDESRKIWRVALPGVISRVCTFGTIVVTQSFIGHISNIDLAGYALVQTLSVRFVNGILLKNMVIAWLSIFRFGIHILLSLLLVYKLNLGVVGAMIALSMSSWFLVIGEFVYIFGGWCPNSWKGFTVAAFKDLVPVVKLSISSGVMLCLELWYYAVLVLLAGYMADAEVSISAFSISVRVSNELGRGSAQAAKFSIKVLLGTSIAMGVFFFVLCLIFGRKLAYLFTNDDRVADTVADLSLLLSLSILLNSIYPILSGVAIGAGMQGSVAIVNLVCFYLIGIPIGAMLELWYDAVLVLLAGYMANAEVAISAFSICLNINTWEFMISFGFLGAAWYYEPFVFKTKPDNKQPNSVRVANELGRGNAKAAKFSIKVLLGTSIAIGVFFFVLSLIFGEKIAYLFTNDDRVADTISDLSLLLSFSILLNSIYPVLSGVAVGAGMQGTAAIVNLVCFYLIGIPIGALLGYLTNLQVKGIWMGMIGGFVTETIALIYMVWAINWDEQVKKASERLNRFYVESPENPEMS
ncbi:hypothetical protein M8C21_007582 [Ambrosia artemisiifolia]|uniref:Protein DETOXIFICATION n=1 Tax=Ambrosia artemisiifolia TaxID=4212 RepID=A0AAD5CV09_AMBAR|nr:hypothetical protein M8C21_007582 [Ambrosia artemisiifolia]